MLGQPRRTDGTEFLVIFRVIPPGEKDGSNRHEPQDRPNRKSEIHRESMTERNESRNGTLSTIDCRSLDENKPDTEEGRTSRSWSGSVACATIVSAGLGRFSRGVPALPP